MPKNKLSFRKGKKTTGLAAIGDPHADTYIRLDGAVIGQITAPSRFGGDKWQPGFLVNTPGSAAGWNWVYLKAKFDFEPEARAWVVDNFSVIQERYDLYTTSDWEPWKD